MTALETVSTARLSPRRAPGPARELAFESIVHVNEKGGSFGGTEEYITLLATQLARRDVRSHLVCGLLTGAVGAELSSVHIVEGLASRQPRPDTGAQLAGVIAGLEPDVIYLHNMFDPAAVLALATLPNRGPLIWYVHDHYLTCLSELRWRRDIGSCPHKLGEGCLVAIGEGHCVLRYPDGSLGPEQLRERLSLSHSLAAADAIVVVSEYMRSLLADAEPRLADRIHLLPRPIRDLGALRPRYRDRPGDPAVITVAGRITPEKGLAVLVEALGAVKDSPPIELRIAGVVEHGAYWSRCQRIQAAAMAANPRLKVIYLGHLDYSATDELFRQSDLVTIPSQWPEPLGAVAIEAMSAGAAVIASHIGGLDTALVDGHNGLLIDPPNVAAWASAIESLLHDPERARRLGAQAHRDAAGSAAGHLAVFNKIIARARRARALG